MLVEITDEDFARDCIYEAVRYLVHEAGLDKDDIEYLLENAVTDTFNP